MAAILNLISKKVPFFFPPGFTCTSLLLTDLFFKLKNQTPYFFCFFLVQAALFTFGRIFYFMAPWLRFQDTNFKCIRSIPYPNTKAHFEDKSWSHSGQWCLNSPPCLLPLHVWWGIPWDKAKPWQYCLPPPQERDWYQKEICTVSCRNRWAPCCSTIYQRGEKAPTGCALCPPVQHLSEAALSHHLPPFTSQHSRKRQSQAFPWRSAWL